MEQGIFIFLGLTTIASAWFVAASQNLVRSVFMFFVTLFAVAGLCVFALADFVAVTQIVIYVGGVLVLMLFTFMLSSKETLEKLEESRHPVFTLKQFPALLVAAAFLIVLVNAIFKLKPDQLGWISQSTNNTFRPQDNTVTNIGTNLMTAYLLPFEAISILLMMALIGAAHLARKERSFD